MSNKNQNAGQQQAGHPAPKRPDHTGAAASATMPQPAQVAAQPAPAAPPHQVVVQPAQPSMSREQIRLECLKLALARGFGGATANMKVALRQQVDLYHEVIAGDAGG